MTDTPDAPGTDDPAAPDPAAPDPAAPDPAAPTAGGGRRSRRRRAPAAAGRGRSGSHHRAGHQGTHEARARRLPVLALVIALLVAGGLVSTMVRPPKPSVVPTSSAALAALAAPASSDASSWYCTGGSGPSNPVAQATLYLVNASRRVVTGTLTAYASTGKTASERIAVPALGEATAAPGTIASGAWLASRVDLNGGGVSVNELVAGATGWSMAPCATETAPDWYFASGATTAGNSLFLSVFNPTPDMAVVDLTFVTGQGPAQPAPFQGLIVQPDAVVTAEVPSYVQDQASVAAVVRAQSGSVIATELQVHSTGGQSGMSLQLGAPATATRWYLPGSMDESGGSSQLVVFNPTTANERVTVAIRIPSGAVSPIVETVPAKSTWTLLLSGQTRIPIGVDYALTVTSRRGGGVVVGQVVAAPAGSSAPQWGEVTAVTAAAAASPTGRWTLPNPALNSAGAEPGAQAGEVALLNPSNRSVRVTVASLAPGGRPLSGADAVRIGPHGIGLVPATDLSDGGQAPLRVTADLPLAVVEEATPVGAVGAVSGAAVPQA